MSIDDYIHNSTGKGEPDKSMMSAITITKKARPGFVPDDRNDHKTIPWDSGVLVAKKPSSLFGWANLGKMRRDP